MFSLPPFRKYRPSEQLRANIMRNSTATKTICKHQIFLKFSLIEFSDFLSSKRSTEDDENKTNKMKKKTFNDIVESLL